MAPFSVRARLRWEGEILPRQKSGPSVYVDPAVEQLAAFYRSNLAG
jgi:hypothetical protein